MQKIKHLTPRRLIKKAGFVRREKREVVYHKGKYALWWKPGESGRDYLLFLWDNRDDYSETGWNFETYSKELCTISNFEQLNNIWPLLNHEQ